MPRLSKVVDRPRVLALAAISRMPGASASRRLTAVGLAVSLPAVLLAVQGSAVPAADPQRPPEPPALVDDAKTPGPVPERSTEYSNTVRNEDGTYTTEASAGPVNFEDESGNWLPISNELVPAPGKAYAVTNEANSFSVSIPEDPSKTPVKFEEDGAWVTMKMIGAGSSKPEVDGSEATFDNVPAADAVTYEATDTGVKETIVLDEPPAAGPAYRYLLRVSPGITPVLTAHQTVEFRDGAGTVKFLIPRGVMNDSADPEPAYSDAVTYTLAETGSSWRFTVIPSASWLDDPARVYPVTIDPTVDKNTQKSCWLQEESAGSTHCGEWILKAGANENLKRRRALVDFNIGGIPPNAAISNATAWIWMDHYSTSGSGGATSWALYNPNQLWGSCASWAYTCHQGGTWTGGGSLGQISTNSVSLGGSSSGWQAWDITARVAGWLSGSYENRGVLLRQTGENVKKVLGFVSETHSNTGLRPLLRVTYTDSPPNVGTPVLRPASSTGTTTIATPTIGAVVTDPEGSSVGACFWIWNLSWTQQLWSGCSTSLYRNGEEVRVNVPANTLQTGQQYNVQALGADGVNWSSNWTSLQFLVDPTALPIIATGKALDVDNGMPIVNASVIARVSQRVGAPQQPGRTDMHLLSSTTTDSSGNFTLRGALNAPATVQPDGSVQVQIDVVGQNQARLMYVNAVPGISGGNWRWSDQAPDPASTHNYASRPVTSDDLAGEEIEDVLIDFSLPTPSTAAGGSAVVGEAQFSARHTDTITAWEAGTMPDLGRQDAEFFSAEEEADVQEDWTALQNGQLAAQERAVAERVIRDCGTLQLPVWEDALNGQGEIIQTEKFLPIKAAYLKYRSMVKYTWTTTEQTSATISITGEGKNVSGGLAFSEVQDDTLGYSGPVKEEANQTYQWRALWKYKKQKEYCFNNGYGYYTGRKRWIPWYFTETLKARTGAVDRWECNSDYRVELTENMWIGQNRRESWSGWFSIGGVAGVSLQRSDSDDVRTDYYIKDGFDEFRLCGKGSLPSSAVFVEEVTVPGE